MSRMKSIFAVLVLAVIVGIVPQAFATGPTVKTAIIGSSALWQTLALGAYNNGTSLVATSTSTAVTVCNATQTAATSAANGGIAPNSTYHFTASTMDIYDSRAGAPGFSQPLIDSNKVWIVWDSCTNAAGTYIPNVWLDDKVDSVVGDRCYFASPKCTMGFPGSVPAPAGLITVWPDGSSDQTQASLESGGAFSAVGDLFSSPATVSISVAATDIRPEDAAWATCRVNSPLGPGTGSGFSASDNLDGLGYSQSGVPQTSGQCYQYTTSAVAAKAGVGYPILSGYPGAATTDSANVASFNLTGKDPIKNTTLPAFPTVYEVGAAPIVFVYSHSSGDGVLDGLTTATEQQLQQAFSGTNCNASAFTSTTFTGSGAINVFLREPISGTYNTTEATVMRYPVIYPTGPQGLSMETGVGNPASLATPYKLATDCAGGGGKRYRAIGTSEEVKSVQNSNSAFTPAQDGIGFTFYSLGNVAPLADSPSYAYIKLDGVDPIWASYTPGIDPGQPTTAGQLPSNLDFPAAATPTGCNKTYPCPENKIWGGGASFPNVRNGTYRAWSLLRLIATGTAGTNASALITASQKYTVLVSPDYVPATAVTLTAAETLAATYGVFDYAITDPGLKLLRSHYQQYDGSGTTIPATSFTCLNEPTTTERCGDMGGMIIPTLVGVTEGTANPWLTQLQIVQSSNTAGDLSPAKRPVAP